MKMKNKNKFDFKTLLSHWKNNYKIKRIFFSHKKNFNTGIFEQSIYNLLQFKLVRSKLFTIWLWLFPINKQKSYVNIWNQILIYKSAWLFSFLRVKIIAWCIYPLF